MYLRMSTVRVRTPNSFTTFCFDETEKGQKGERGAVVKWPQLALSSLAMPSRGVGKKRKHLFCLFAGHSKMRGQKGRPWQGRRRKKNRERGEEDCLTTPAFQISAMFVQVFDGRSLPKSSSCVLSTRAANLSHGSSCCYPTI